MQPLRDQISRLSGRAADRNLCSWLKKNVYFQLYVFSISFCTTYDILDPV